MPIIENSSFRSPWYYGGPHWQTVLPNVTRRRLRISYRRERFELSDGDFVDVDWVAKPAQASLARCCLALHGLEGDSQAPYVKALIRSFEGQGYAMGALNLRGCSGEPNRLKRFYHSGDTLGLAEVVEKVGSRFETVVLVGFSLGGNVVLKYLGDLGNQAPGSVRAAVAFSVPCDLAGAAEKLAESSNQFYMKRFVRMLCSKLKEKSRLYPQYEYAEGCANMKTFHEFDEVYTAPLNGFKGAKDYWARCSSLHSLDGISRPTLLVNAANDPFLSPACYPREIARSHSSFHLEVPEWGGHCGFPRGLLHGGPWHGLRALEFFESL